MKPWASVRLVLGDAAALQDVFEILRVHESELRRLGVLHAAMFGSVARGQAVSGSDIDVLIELDDRRG